MIFCRFFVFNTLLPGLLKSDTISIFASLGLKTLNKCPGLKSKLRCTIYGTRVVINNYSSQGPVAHACNLSYSGGRDQEDLSLKTAPGLSLIVHETLFKKKNLHKKSAVM
jgi:hypothetical protein